MNKKLWCDLKTNRERYEFLISGRAVETGIVSPAIVDDIAKVFKYFEHLPELLSLKVEGSTVLDDLLAAYEKITKEFI
jgi:hypothetical protein